MKRLETVMSTRRAITIAVSVAVFAAGIIAAITPAQSQSPPPVPSARIIVTGEGKSHGRRLNHGPGYGPAL